MIVRSKSNKGSTNLTIDNNIVQKEFCVDCYTELHYYDYCITNENNR